MYFLNWHVVISIQLISILCRFFSCFFSLGFVGFFCVRLVTMLFEILNVDKFFQKDLISFILILWQLFCIYANI